MQYLYEISFRMTNNLRVISSSHVARFILYIWGSFRLCSIFFFFLLQTEQFTVLWLLFAMIVVGNIAVLIGLQWGKRRKTRMDFFIKQLAFAGKLFRFCFSKVLHGLLPEKLINSIGFWNMIKKEEMRIYSITWNKIWLLYKIGHLNISIMSKKMYQIKLTWHNSMWIIFLMERLNVIKTLYDFSLSEKYLYQIDESLIWHINNNQYIEIVCYKNVK